MKIYCITNKLNNKKYIGMTKNSLACRLRGHRKSGTMKDIIKEHGAENFFIVCLEETTDKDKASFLESYYIEKLKTYEPYGYNRQLGGKSNFKLSEIALKRISLGQKRRFKNQKHPSKGKAGKLNAKSKAIKCLSNNQIYESARQAAIALGLNRNSVARAARGERSSINGLVFKYV